LSFPGSIRIGDPDWHSMNEIGALDAVSSREIATKRILPGDNITGGAVRE